MDEKSSKIASIVKSDTIKIDQNKTEENAKLNGNQNSLDQIEELAGFSNVEEAKISGEIADKNSKKPKSQVTGSKRSSLSSTQVLALKLEAKKKLAALENERLQREKEIIELELKLQLSQAGSSVSTHIDKSISEMDQRSTSEDNDIQKVNKWLEKNKNELLDQVGVDRLVVENYSCKDLDNKTVENRNRNEDKLEKILLRQTINTELPFFSGNVKEWPNFYNQYTYTCRTLALTDEENVCRLGKCLKGEARRSVEGLLISTSVPASSIIEILKNKYGRPDIIVRTLVNEAKNMSFIKNNDFVALTNFAETVTNLVLTFESLSMQNYLSCPQLMDELMQKLPYRLQLSWGEKISRNQGIYSLTEFKNWIHEKAQAASYVQSMVTRTNPNDRFKRTMVVSNNQAVKAYSKNCKVCDEQHDLEKCKKFADMTVYEKWDFIKNKNLCFCCLKSSHKIVECKRKRNCGVSSCQKMHHQLLHFENMRDNFDRPRHQETGSTNNQDRNNETIPSTSNQMIAHTARDVHSEIFLKVAPVVIKTETRKMKIFALFDEGSTITLLDEEIANDLQLCGPESTLNLRWTDQKTLKQATSRRVSFEIAAEGENQFYNMENVQTIKDMDLPVQNINVTKMQNRWKHLERIDLTNLQGAHQPKLLIGQDYWDLITTRKLIEGPKNSPALSYTKLGWVIHGHVRQFRGRINDPISLHIKHEIKDEELHDIVKYFFTLESLGVKYHNKKEQSKEDEIAENLIKKVSQRKHDRWETGLLWKKEEQDLPDSKPLALQRFQYIEKKMIRDASFAEAYQQKITEYEEKGYARKLTKQEAEDITNKVWYLPQFAVVNPNKPGKMRFVFDAAAKVDGKSLNDFLLKGPDLYNSLISILFKFREKAIAFSADVREMFHQVLIRKEDQDAQRFLFRKSPTENMSTDVMQVMIFGAVSSPYSAQYIKNANALEFENEYPQAVERIVHRHYMDDYLDSANTPEEAAILINDVINIHKKGGFDLRGWVCNSKEVIKNIPLELRNTQKTFESSNTPTRILGLQWDPVVDILSFPLTLHKVEYEIISGQKVPTKRQMLKVIMSVFDPLGFLGHFIVRAKMLMQEIWKSGLNWDAEISNIQYKKWKIWINGLQKIRELKIQRCYNLDYIQVKSLQLHVFCDASELAFSTVAYFRFEVGAKIHISIVMSKSQVSPLKQITIPRKELQAAVMASRLSKIIQKEHTLKIHKICYWTDSSTHWLRSETKKLPSFVSNRVAEILENTNVSQWRWVPSKLNIADEATRDDKEAQLDIASTWFIGPEFLYLTPFFWPEETTDVEVKNCKTNVVLVNTTRDNPELPDVSKFSSWYKIIKTTAYVLKFIKILQKKETSTGISCKDLDTAENLWCLKVQKEIFSEEYKALSKGKVVSKESRLYRLSPFLNQGLICIDGRIDNAPDLCIGAKKPIIMDNKHRYTKLLIKYYHENNKHAGLQLVLNEIRQKFWIIQARKTITGIINECNFCRIRKAKPKIPLMGKLPIERLQKPLRAFTYTAVDYFGPMEVTIGRRREKKYGVLFTCLSIRAVHIEVADSLNTDSALLAIRRFIGRRGQPFLMLSDNGTNLTSANKELKEAIKNIDPELIERKLVADRIQWKFSAPASPHMNGAWERMVKSVKQTLKIILKEQRPKFEVLQTVMIEAEHTVNSRPLTYVSASENDLESITPNHFLIGTSSISKPMGVFPEKIDLRKHWRYSQQLSEHFWNRWVKEYLPTLIPRSKWLSEQRNVQIGEVVVVVDNQLPRNNWPLGKIVTVHPGKDGKTRVVEVKTKTGIYKRPVTKICPIGLLEESNSEEITGGRNVQI